MSNWYEVAQGSQDERLRQVADYLNTPQPKRRLLQKFGRRGPRVWWRIGVELTQGPWGHVYVPVGMGTMREYGRNQHDEMVHVRNFRRQAFRVYLPHIGVAPFGGYVPQVPPWDGKQMVSAW